MRLRNTGIIHLTEFVLVPRQGLLYILQKYHRTAFKLEKAEIKKEIAEKAEEIKRHEKTFRHLQKKVEKRLKKYQKEHAKLPNLTAIVKEVCCIAIFYFLRDLMFSLNIFYSRIYK